MALDLFLSVTRIVSSTSTDGPGLRTALYLQGCNIHCPGCHNSSLWDISAGELLYVEAIWEQLQESDENISILGGEPLMQYVVLTAFCKLIKERIDKSIWLWSGYTLSHIQQHYPEILKWVDVVVDGPFIKGLANPTLRFRGSSNQQITPISQLGIKEYNMI